MAEETAGDPMSALKWTHKSLRKIQQALAAEHVISPPTISRLLQERDYSLRVNHKRLAGKQAPHRDEQFRYIVRWRQAFQRHQWPAISVDTNLWALHWPTLSGGFIEIYLFPLVVL